MIYQYKSVKGRPMLPDSEMNDLGQAGWELVHIIEDYSRGFCMYVFKREVK